MITVDIILDLLFNRVIITNKYVQIYDAYCIAFNYNIVYLFKKIHSSTALKNENQNNNTLYVFITNKNQV